MSEHQTQSQSQSRSATRSQPRPLNESALERVAGGYLKLDGIKGESTDTRHKES